MGKKIAAAVLAIIFLAYAPKQTWFAYQQHRLDSIEERSRSCQTSNCRNQLNAELDAFHADVTNRPWYVWGGSMF